MDEWFTAFTPKDLSDGIIGILLILAVARGWLVPKITVDAERKNHTEQVALLQTLLSRADNAAELWREAWQESEKGREVSIEQVSELLEGLATTNAVLNALPKTVSRGGTDERPSR